MEIIIKQGNDTNAYLTESFIENEAELANVSISNKVCGSKVICIDTGNVYVLNSKYQWALLGGGSV